jgi:DNA-binding SARP family transcriptional activator
MRVELLGTVQVRDDAGGPAHVGGPRARALLALLALDAGRVVPAASLIDRLWDGDPPEGARSALQSMISRLRGVLGTSIESHPAGYRLAVDRDQVDALAFEELAGQGSRALAGGDPARASAIRTAAREQLGEAAFDAAYRHGRGLPYAEALVFAEASAAPASERAATS